MFFCKEKRGELLKANPEWKVTDVGKKLGELWGQLTDAGKAKYQKMAEADKERYAKEMLKYKPSA